MGCKQRVSHRMWNGTATSKGNLIPSQLRLIRKGTQLFVAATQLSLHAFFAVAHVLAVILSPHTR